MSPTLLVFGRNGQLASALAEHPDLARWDTRFLDRTQCDFSRPELVSEALDAVGPFDIAINAVAFNDVDGAESDDRDAHRVNAETPGRVARYCAERGRPLLHVSTDFVFPGRDRGMYREDDEAAPLNAYGRSKRAGEVAVLEAGDRHAVFRTAWVYAATHRNFVTAMLAQIGQRDAVRVVADQIGNPTAARTLAGGLLRAAEGLLSGTAPGGLYHLCGRESVSRAGLAREIYRMASAAGHEVPRVIDIASDAWPGPAPRPGNASLDCRHFEAVFDMTLPPWRDSLAYEVSLWAGKVVSAPARS